ncbi:MAG: UDP-3-O-(3-hydroxymyristoyl)glucosamine N-acyltransferase [Bacteroidetes bacterium]|nr:MAG: UDP-3-O-(3-hydroxymyristoyl)glucosamine N-acyltransferase [Bacteroidota bacterium]
MLTTAGQLCRLLGGKLEGDPDVTIDKPSKIEEAQKGSLSFLANPKYEAFVYETEASVLLVSDDFVPSKPLALTLIRVPDVYASLGVLLEKFNAEEKLQSGVSSLAFVHPDATIGENVTISPFSYIGARASIGDNVVIYPQAFVGENVRIGASTKIYAGVKIYHDCVIGEWCVIHSNSVLGSDGFGFARTENGAFSKIAQVGNVRVEDKVEVGANTVIDRATMGSTLIRKGVKLDNLIQIAHNVEIGEDTAIAAQAGIAGSTHLGSNVLIGGQAGLAGHITIADGVQVQAQSGVAASIDKKGERLYGSPAIKYIDYLKSYSIFRKLPELQKRLNELEKELNALRDREDS